MDICTTRYIRSSKRGWLIYGPTPHSADTTAVAKSFLMQHRTNSSIQHSKFWMIRGIHSCLKVSQANILIHFLSVQQFILSDASLGTSSSYSAIEVDHANRVQRKPTVQFQGRQEAEGCHVSDVHDLITLCAGVC